MLNSSEQDLVTVGVDRRRGKSHRWEDITLEKPSAEEGV